MASGISICWCISPQSPRHAERDRSLLIRTRFAGPARHDADVSPSRATGSDRCAHAVSNARYTAQNHICNDCKIDYVVIAGQPTIQERQTFTDGSIFLLFFESFSRARRLLLEGFLAMFQLSRKFFFLTRTYFLHVDMIYDKFTHCSPLCFVDMERLSDGDGNVKRLVKSRG